MGFCAIGNFVDKPPGTAIGVTPFINKRYRFLGDRTFEGLEWW